MESGLGLWLIDRAFGSLGFGAGLQFQVVCPHVSSASRRLTEVTGRDQGDEGKRISFHKEANCPQSLSLRLRRTSAIFGVCAGCTSHVTKRWQDQTAVLSALSSQETSQGSQRHELMENVDPSQVYNRFPRHTLLELECLGWCGILRLRALGAHLSEEKCCESGCPSKLRVGRCLRNGMLIPLVKPQKQQAAQPRLLNLLSYSRRASLRGL